MYTLRDLVNNVSTAFVVNNKDKPVETIHINHTPLREEGYLHHWERERDRRLQWLNILMHTVTGTLSNGLNLRMPSHCSKLLGWTELSA